jgi:hypothetical protein
MVLMTVLQEELEGGPLVETELTLTVTVAKVVPRARAARQVIAVPGQAHPLQVVTVEQATIGMDHLEVLVGRMEVDLVAAVIILIPFLQEEGVVAPGILGVEVEH